MSTSKPTKTKVNSDPPFAVVDASFVGAQGWALGSTACGSGAHRCAALAHTTDGGRQWTRLRPPPAHIDDPLHPNNVDDTDCRSPCVGKLRFVTDNIGYLFDGSESVDGKRALFITLDAGHSWHRQPGGADAVVASDGTVLRVTDSGGCPPHCRYFLKRSPIGGTKWTSVALPTEWDSGTGIGLVRHHAHAAAELYGFPAGGGNNAHSRLMTSSDDGASWINRYEPCQREAQRDTCKEVDSVNFSQAPDGTLAVLCMLRTEGGRLSVATSADNGARFISGPTRRLLRDDQDVWAFAAASRRTVLISVADGPGSIHGATYRTTDAGRTFTEVTGPLRSITFTSPTTGYGISTNEANINTTTDNGRTWHRTTIH